MDVADFADAEALLADLDLGCRGCVVSDMNLPGKSGAAILAHVRQQGSPMPVILISGRASPQMRDDMLARGADAFFHKPVPAARLLAMLDGFEAALC